MKLIWFVVITAVFTLILVACGGNRSGAEPTAEDVDVLASGTIEPAPTATVQLHGLPNMGEAPEIENEVWVNADAPVTLASQRGKVVLLEFWTFG